MMRKVATKTTIRINIAPPIMPPNSGVDKPPFDDPVAAVFAIVEAGGVSLARFPSVVEDPVGSPKTVTEVIVVVIVVGKESTVVVSVSVTVNVVGIVS
jgi:hypothetical protein